MLNPLSREWTWQEGDQSGKEILTSTGRDDPLIDRVYESLKKLHAVNPQGSICPPSCSALLEEPLTYRSGSHELAVVPRPPSC